MNSKSPSYRGYRFPPEIISHAVWLYHRFCVSFRDVEDLLAQRGITVSYEAVRLWCLKFGPEYARRLKRRQSRLGDTWYLDEVFVTIQGRRQYLWRAVDQDGDVIDILVQSRRDRRAAKRFFRKLLKHQGATPWRLVTDKLRSYGAAHRTVMPSVVHSTEQYEEQPSRNLAPADAATTTTDAKVQISKSSAAILVRAWTCPKPLPRRPAFVASASSSRATRSLFPRLGRSNVRGVTRTERHSAAAGLLAQRQLDSTAANRASTTSDGIPRVVELEVYALLEAAFWRFPFKAPRSSRNRYRKPAFPPL